MMGTLKYPFIKGEHNILKYIPDGYSKHTSLKLGRKMLFQTHFIETGQENVISNSLH